jgi:hypothetical protein
MQYTDYTGILPAQRVGKELETSEESVFHSENAADDFYSIARRRLLDVNHWHEIAGFVSAKFQLVDANGAALDREMQEGDLIKIDIPGPGSSVGQGYDWVRIIRLKTYEDGSIQSIAFQVRPTKNPTSDEIAIAHFYGDEATSTFAVNKVGMTIAAFVIDRNLLPNEESANLVDKLRNSAVGIGALGMFSKLQWKGLVTGIVASKTE